MCSYIYIYLWRIDTIFLDGLVIPRIVFFIDPTGRILNLFLDIDIVEYERISRFFF